MRRKRFFAVVSILAGIAASVSAVAFAEWTLARRGVMPHMRWFWDASVLCPAPAFLPDPADPSRVKTDPRLVLADNPPESFTVRKPSGTVRVFCIGGSTTRGWPYQARASYPHWLAGMVRDAAGAKPVEIINAGFHNYDTKRILEVGREVMRYDPDIIIVFAGHNDYGDFPLRHKGGAAAIGLRRLHSWLVLHSRLYDAILNFSKAPQETAMIRAHATLDGDEIEALLRDYESDLRAFIRDCRRRKIEPVLMNLAFTEKFWGSSPLTREVWPEMNRILARVSKEDGVALADIRELSRQPDGLIDSMHGTERGYRFMAGRALNALFHTAKFAMFQSHVD